MKAQIIGYENTPAGLTLQVLPPNEVTDSKHAKLIRGLKYVLENSRFQSELDNYLENDPFTLSREYLDILSASDGAGTLSYIIAESLTRFPKKDFERFGDRNCLGSVSRAWFNDRGTHLDVQADIISLAHSRDITTNDLTEHVMTFKPGEYSKPLAFELSRILTAFRNNFDFNLTPAYARFLLDTKVANNDAPPF